MRLTDQNRKRISALRQAKFRKEYGLSLVEGTRAVRAAITAGAPLVDLIATTEALESIGVAIPPGLTVYVVTPAVIDRITDVSTSQGVLATFTIPDQGSLEGADRWGRVVLLDGVQDPGNVGTIVRTAAWFGVDAIIAGAGTADAFSPKVARASMGALWSIAVRRTEDLSQVVRHLHAGGMMVFGADASGRPPDDSEILGVSRVGLVLGAEARGISAEVATAASELLAIPSAAKGPAGVDSLNVAVAAGILMHRLFGASRQA